VANPIRGGHTKAREDSYAWKNGRPGERFAIDSHLVHQAGKLARRIDANLYIALTQAMSLFELGRIHQPGTVLGMGCNRLFPREQQQPLANLAQGARALQMAHSLHGHDGFLGEADQLEGIVQESVGGWLCDCGSAWALAAIRYCRRPR
jgi:homoserine O-acetyltransferase